ncbi:MAG TPA: hypothetical protein VF185_00895 [Patescibacteria group bacterium]
MKTFVNKADFENAIIFLAEKLKDYDYAIRGTSSLVLSGIAMNVDDIDVVCDKKTALACNQILKEYLVEKVEYRESEKFKSYFGKFKINGIQVEIMGEWEILNPKGEWVGPFNGRERMEVEVKGKKVWVTTIEEELKSFMAMGRWNAYHKIRSQIPLDKQATAK